MTKNSFEQAWRATRSAIDDPLRGLPPVVLREISEGGPTDARNWDPLVDLPGPTDTLVHDLARVACADYDHEYRKLFLRWAVETADKALADHRWNRPRYPRNPSAAHGRLLCHAALVRAWAVDADVDASLLTQGADEIADELGAMRRWIGEADESDWLLAAQFKLIAGDIEGAHALIHVRRRSFSRTRMYFDWTKAVIDLLHKPSPDGRQRLFHTFDGLFDVVRDPAWRIAVRPEPPGEALIDTAAKLRLRMALIRWRYVERQPLAGHWRKVIAQITR